MRYHANVPANSGLRADDDVWEQVSDELSALICSWSGCYGSVLKRRSIVPAPLGYFKIVSKKNQQSVFIKVIFKKHLNKHIYAERIARWLQSQTIKTNCLLKGFPRLISDGLCILAYPFIEGEFARDVDSDLSRLGTSLAKLHDALRRCPWADQIRGRGYRRDSRLLEVFLKIRRGEVREGSIPESAKTLLLSEVEPTILDTLLNGSQVVHGDVNYGNVLFSKQRRDVFFLDFEDTMDSWMSPLAELSFVIERFAIVANEKDSLQLSSALIRSYVSSGGTTFERSSQISDFLRALSIRSLLRLGSAAENHESIVLSSEWEKFVRLYRQALIRRELLEAVFCSINAKKVRAQKS